MIKFYEKMLPIFYEKKYYRIKLNNVINNAVLLTSAIVFFSIDLAACMSLSAFLAPSEIADSTWI